MVEKNYWKISPGEYVEYYHWDYNEYNGESLPDFARPIDRFLSEIWEVSKVEANYLLEQNLSRLLAEG